MCVYIMLCGWGGIIPGTEEEQPTCHKNSHFIDTDLQNTEILLQDFVHRKTWIECCYKWQIINQETAQLFYQHYAISKFGQIFV